MLYMYRRVASTRNSSVIIHTKTNVENLSSTRNYTKSFKNHLKNITKASIKVLVEIKPATVEQKYHIFGILT